MSSDRWETFFGVQEVTFYFVRTGNDVVQVRRDPPRPNQGNIPHRDPELVEWLGSQGHESVEEWTANAEPAEDYRTEYCEHCGKLGADLHHWSERQIFGEDADAWPTGWLCTGPGSCHEQWHRRMDAWADAIDLLTTNEDDPILRRPAGTLSEAQKKRAEEVAATLESIARNGRGKVSSSAKYLAYRIHRLLNMQ
jgi:hypothetical protein